MKKRRAALGISQMDLAELVDVSPGYIGEIEMGRKFPGAEVIERIAQELHVRPYRLFMAERDLAEAAESASIEAFYSAAGEFKDRINRELDALVEARVPGRSRESPEPETPKALDEESEPPEKTRRGKK